MCACPSAFAGTTWSFVAGLVLRTIPERRSAWGGQSASVPIILIGTEMVGTAQVRLCPPYGFNFQTATFYTDTASRSRRACARVLLDVLPLRNQRAWGMPGARCTRSLVCSVLVEHTSVVTTGPPEHPAFPHAMVLTAYSVLSPATNSSCHRHPRIKVLSKPGRADFTSANLTTATGPRTTRLCRPLQSPFVSSPFDRSQVHINEPALRSRRAPNAAASTASRPASVTIAIRPSRGTRRRGYRFDLGQARTGIFLKKGLDC